jgi:hypothetical protein
MTISHANMIENCLVGLNIINVKFPNTTLNVQGYLIYVAKKKSEFSKAEQLSLQDAGWKFDKLYGLIFSTVG